LSPENRYRRRERQRRVYTVTQTKAIVGFLLSLLFSLMLSPAFEKFSTFVYVPLKNSIINAYRPNAQVPTEDDDIPIEPKRRRYPNEDSVKRLERINRDLKDSYEVPE
jgi:hypothetical protein